ncbi:helix-turn-helix transcriptional regulator [Mycobacterium deserti]|uniref:AAA family ATPase n=1 Tax=Mycobacterium deserti TaxID=2978347 RepID=A0ABT2M6D3_9MYCO|nr:LuxR family transcriptional regulator [Mycobacterium deserti]MCT7656965.1 AAA family ATPase [Mycobacterium deserti]
MYLVGRKAERQALDDLLAAVREGTSSTLVVTGEAGIGKTALLDHVADQASGLLVTRVAGIDSEMEFAFAALHQLCAPMAERLDRIPKPQRDALRTTFGEREGPAPDPFLVGLAVLSLLSEAAAQRPVLVLVDDQQWLDLASAQVLTFVARRLVAESVGMVFATRVVGGLAGLPELTVSPLRDEESHALLATVLDGPLDPRVRDRILAEAHGNPLALVEFSRSLRSEELAGGFGAPGAPLSHSLEGTFRRQVEALPAATRRLLALAAADPAGDPSLLWSAAELLGLATEAAEPAIESGLAEIGTRVRFRHPLIRATAYRSVPLSDRRRIHGALAAVTDEAVDPDRRAWHLGHAAVGPDDTVADELERSAGRVQARGGITAAAAFLERASSLTLDRHRRCDLAIAAASAKAQAGMLDGAREMLAVAEAEPLSDRQRAQADLARAELAYVTRRGNDAAPLMLSAARRLEAIDGTLARDTYLAALSAAVFAGRLAADGDVLEVSEAASAATRALSDPRPADLLLDGLATQHSAGFDKGLPAVHEALRIYGHRMTAEQELRWMWLANVAAARVWDMDRLTSLAQRHVQLARETGALSQLPLALSSYISVLLFRGQMAEASAQIDELRSLVEAMGETMTPYGAISLAAMRGDKAKLLSLTDTTIRDATRRGEGVGLTVAAWANALLHNGFGDYWDAMNEGLYATAYRGDCTSSGWALVELVEAAARSGEADVAADALERLSEMTAPSATDWGLGVEARSRALLSDGATAEHLYRDAIERFTRAGMRPDLGRSHLLYGEWLRRQRRRVDARYHLRSAHEIFEALGMAAFADRARRELSATGEKARSRAPQAAVRELTAQEAQVARLARAGLSNPEIGARLFISARTVQYHLGKVFTKLGIRSRSQLDSALSDADG